MVSREPQQSWHTRTHIFEHLTSNILCRFHTPSLQAVQWCKHPPTNTLCRNTRNIRATHPRLCSDALSPVPVSPPNPFLGLIHFLALHLASITSLTLHPSGGRRALATMSRRYPSLHPYRSHITIH